MFDEFSKSLIGDGCSYQKSNKDLNNFLKYDLRNYFTGSTSLFEKWKSHSFGLTFSHYVFPIVLRHIDATTPSTQFLLFVISDFQSGA